MAEAIQFHCPACGITLRVPVAASGTRGPCPRCQQDIICPDLATGVGAHRAHALPAVAFRDSDPFSLFSGPASTPIPAPPPEPEPIPEAEPAPEHEPILPDTPPSPAAPSLEPSIPLRAKPGAHPDKLLRTILILSCAVTGLIGLVGGYWLGLHSHAPAEAPVPAAAPVVPQAPVAPDPEINHAPVTPLVPQPPTIPAPTPDQSQASPENPPLKIIAAPEAALKAFLAAPDWQTRAKHVLHSERLLEKMERYHWDIPDGPTVALSLKQDATLDDPETGTRLLTYRVATKDAPEGIPVAIVHTDAGWKIDWETFVEFRDDHFRRFAAGEGSEAGAFHLLVRNSHYFGELFPGSDKLTAFRVDPPLPERGQHAFVPTGSDLHKTLAAATEGGRPCASVLQLVRKKHDDGKTHLEVTAILAPNWRPEE